MTCRLLQGDWIEVLRDGSWCCSEQCRVKRDDALSKAQEEGSPKFQYLSQR